MKYIFYLFVAFTLLACGSNNQQGSDQAPTSDRVTRLSPEERNRLIANPAFEAVFLNQTATVQTLLDSEEPGTMELFRQPNLAGRTALMEAIRLRREEIANRMIRRMGVDSLISHRDGEGRGYLSYLSEEGFVELIDRLVERYDSEHDFTYDMQDLDPQDVRGRTAVFYARNREVISTLQAKYIENSSWGWVDSATWMEVFDRTWDNEGNSYLHTAAEENRYDVILWYAQKHCDPGDVEHSNWDYFKSSVGNVLHASTSWATPPRVINKQNNDGDSALHIASRLGLPEVARALISCRFQIFSLENNSGRNPLAELLATSDRYQNPLDQSRRETFNELYIERTESWSYWYLQPSVYIDQQDQGGRTSMHHAAFLADPYFYETLLPFGDDSISDHGDLTPRQIFNREHQ